MTFTRPITILLAFCSFLLTICCAWAAVRNEWFSATGCAMIAAWCWNTVSDEILA